jgi:hypothetical protein
VNRYKKEEEKKRREAREDLTPEQVRQLDIEDKQNAAIEKLAREIHGEKFSEEFDFMYDDSWDASVRKSGKNPMKESYIAKINEKRRNLGVSPLSESGMSQSNDTWELCLEEAKKIIMGKQ